MSLALIWVASCTHSSMTRDTVSGVVQSGTIRAKDISEASGLAASNSRQGVFWVNNDSWNPASLFAINAQGDKLAEIRVSGEVNTDWEDLATFRHNGKSYIVIGDVGDNGSNRQFVSLIFIEEPSVKVDKTNQIFVVKPAWKVNFQYEDGPRDVESLAIDQNRGKALLLSKRDDIPVLYELPLVFSSHKTPLIAKRLGKIKPLPKPHEAYFRLLDVLGLTDWPTGMDISPDGRYLAVLTYGDAYLYTRPEHSDWLSVMEKSPAVIPLPELKQGEAIGFDHHAHHLYITTEKLPAPVIWVDVDQFRSDTVQLTHQEKKETRM